MLADGSLLPSSWIVLFEAVDLLLKIFAIVASYFFSVGLFLASLYVIHFLFSLPLRRNEHARLFLNLVEDAIKRGQTIEEMILSIAQSRDRMVGVRFHLIAAYIESGLKFGEALKKVPRFLPPQIVAMLRAGEKLGDLQKVLPASREILRDRTSAVCSATHYLILTLLISSPVFVTVTLLTTIFVIPRLKDVFAGMGVSYSTEAVFVFGNTNFLVGIEIIVSLLLAVVVLLYIGGPQFTDLFQIKNLPIVDWIAWRIPWKQKQLQRTFSAMLAVLLDSGVPEAEAVRLAGESTANEICRRRAQRIIAALERGVKLDDAVRAFDDSGEFHWRLTNAIHARGGFLNALRGWHEALDAKAFQQQETTAHVITSGVVILNGIFVALIATATFGMLVLMLKGLVGDQ
ncbi:MAG TPA: type II secretion system F family protein [Verrucomicrobiae bacterium]|nr:type II secretion system F family protein [Verrucomicrobiae bacterium]